MKLLEVQVDGFGVWRDLRIDGLSPELTVFYGPNEAGKTTLMHFLRSMLYGVTPERRERYLPPREGGRPGGAVRIASDDGVFEVARYVERGEDDLGRVVVTLDDGEQQGDRLLRDSLEGVDERTFNNVFAIGLDEINELGALEGAEAARWIYRLTSGLDRVSLYDVIQGLRASRRQLLAPAGEHSVLGELVARRDRLRHEIDELSAGGRAWAKLAVELEEADRQSDELEAARKQAETRARRVEVALGIKPQWLERSRVEDERLRFAGLTPLPEGAIPRLDELGARLDEQQREREVLQGQRRQLHEQIRETGVNEALVRSGGRLEGLAEQQDWLGALDRQIASLRAEAGQLDALVESEASRLAKLWRHKPAPDAAPKLTEQTLERLRPAAEAVRLAEQLLNEAKRDADARRGDERQYQAQLESALASSERLGLPNDIEAAGDLVAQLRRRLKAEQKLEQARRQALELDQQSRDLIDQQVMPIEWFTVLTLGFVICGVTFCWQWITGEPNGAWWIGGLLGGLALLAARFFFEDQAADQLDACQQQVDLAARQITEALKEQSTLDEELPMREGSVVLRLQNAERHLAELEKMLPVEAERRKANQFASSAEDALESARRDVASAEREWKSALRSVGLPDETTATELERLATQHRGLDELRAKRKRLGDDVQVAEKEREKLTQRIVSLAEESGLRKDKLAPAEQLAHLLSERRLQQGRLEQRKKLRLRAAELKQRVHKLARAMERVEQERLGMFRAAGVDSEEAYRKRAADLAELARLDEKRDRLSREISVAIGKAGVEADFAPLLAPDSIHRLEAEMDSLASLRADAEARLREAVARRGALEAQRQAIAADTTLADRQIDLDQVEAQIDEARERWRERAAVGAMLELIRSDYEQNRQPETLLEASRHLERLTRGRYPRVWTPLAEDVLMVDDADGVSIAVERLSRGAREQLFLSVRLALVAMYARRGVQLPMILDDVLVNFDDGRAQIAAEVLSDFARQGHQLLVFTCHEHVWKMFHDQRADVRRLPNRFGEEPIEPDPPAVEEAAEEEVLPEAPDAPVAAPPPEPLARPRKKKRRAPLPANPAPPPPPVRYVVARYEAQDEILPVPGPIPPVAEAPPEAARSDAPPPEPETIYEAPYGAAPGAPTRAVYGAPHELAGYATAEPIEYGAARPMARVAPREELGYAYVDGEPEPVAWRAARPWDEPMLYEAAGEFDGLDGLGEREELRDPTASPYGEAPAASDESVGWLEEAADAWRR